MDWTTRKLFDLACELEPDLRPACFIEAKANGCPDAIIEEVRDLIANASAADRAANSTSQLASVRTAAERAVVLGVLQRIGPYRIEKILARGGFGVVYLAEQESPVRRQVAVKVLDPGRATPQALRYFEQEREVLALLRHPNIASLLDAGQTPSLQTYIVMELVGQQQDGECVPADSITAYCDRHRMPIDARLDLFLEVCHAVQHANARGVIHRDLKPSNILVAQVEGKAVPKVIDFGIAKLSEGGAASAKVTQGGVPLGSLAYMSPEQAAGERAISVQTDVYSLGVVLYELISGVLPVDPAESSLLDVLSAIKAGKLPAVSDRLDHWAMSPTGSDAMGAAEADRGTDSDSLRKLIRRELQWIPAKAMHAETKQRYATVVALADDVRRYRRSEPPVAVPQSVWYQSRKFVQRHRTAVAGYAIVVVLVTAGLLGAKAYQHVMATQRAIREIAIAMVRSEAELTRTRESMSRSQERGDWEAVLQACEKLAELGEIDYAGIRTHRAAALAGLGKRDEALAEIRLALVDSNIGRHESQALLWSGDLQLLGMSPDDDQALAVGQIRSAIGLAQRDTSQEFDRADLLYAEGLLAEDMRGARDKFEAAIAQRPNHVRAMNMAMVTSMLTGRPRAVLDYATRLAAMSPRDPQYVAWKAIAYAFLKDPAEAKAQLAGLDPVKHRALLELTRTSVESIEELQTASWDPLATDTRAEMALFNRLQSLACGFNRFLAQENVPFRSIPAMAKSRAAAANVLLRLMATGGKFTPAVMESAAAVTDLAGESLGHLLRATYEFDEGNYDAADVWMDMADSGSSVIDLTRSRVVFRFAIAGTRWKAAPTEENRAKLEASLKSAIEKTEPQEYAWSTYAKTAAAIDRKDLVRVCLSGLMSRFPKSFSHHLRMVEYETRWGNVLTAIDIASQIPQDNTERQKAVEIISEAVKKSGASLDERIRLIGLSI